MHNCIKIISVVSVLAAMFSETWSLPGPPAFPEPTIKAAAYTLRSSSAGEREPLIVKPVDATQSTTSNSSIRVASLDQMRGFVMAAMLLVNFVGNYNNVPGILKHGFGRRVAVAIPDLGEHRFSKSNSNP